MLFKEPVVTVNATHLRSLSVQHLTLDVTLDLENPNPIGITLKSLAFDCLYLQGSEQVFLSHGKKMGFRLRVGKNELTVPVMVENTAPLSVIVAMVATGRITVKVTGVALADFVLLSPKVPFSKEMTIPLSMGDLLNG